MLFRFFFSAHILVILFFLVRGHGGAGAAANETSKRDHLGNRKTVLFFLHLSLLVDKYPIDIPET